MPPPSFNFTFLITYRSSSPVLPQTSCVPKWISALFLLKPALFSLFFFINALSTHPPASTKNLNFILDNVVCRKEWGFGGSKRTEFETCLSHWPAALGLDNLFNFSEYIFSLENRNINILTRLSHIRPSKTFISFLFFLFLFSSLLLSFLPCHFYPFLSFPFFSFPPPPPLQINHQVLSIMHPR